MWKGTNRSPRVWMLTTGTLNSPLMTGIQRRPSVRRRLASAVGLILKAAVLKLCSAVLSAPVVVSKR